MASKLLQEQIDFQSILRNINNRSTPQYYKRIRHYLDKDYTQAHKEYNSAGGYFYILDVSAIGLGCKVIFNDSNQSDLEAEKKKGYITPYTKFFINSPLSADAWIDIAVGYYTPTFFQALDNSDDIDILSELQKIYDNLRPQSNIDWGQKTVGTSEVALTSAAVDPEKRVYILQADQDNTADIWLGLAGVTTSNSFARLSPGQAFSTSDISASISGISTAAGQTVHTARIE